MAHCKICTDKITLTDDEVRYQRTRKYCDACAGLSVEDRLLVAINCISQNIEARLDDLIEATNENLEITNHRLNKLEETKPSKPKSKNKSKSKSSE